MSNFSDHFSALTDLSEQVRLASPTEAIRLLIDLCNYRVPVNNWLEQINLLAIRSANAGSLAYALSEINPVSSNEAQRILDLVIPLYDALIEDVSNAGMDSTSTDLRNVKSRVVTFLENLVLTRPELITVTYNNSLPASVIAYMLYRDAERADELVMENDPVNPLFMPNSVLALSS